MAPAVTPASEANRRGPLQWHWPIDPVPVVLHRFEIGPQRWSAGHRGVDLAASPGTLIRAPADGVVSFAGMVAGRPVISIHHGGTLISSIEPVPATAHPGQQVSAGDVVGRLSPIPGHCMPSACLHWGVRAAGRYIDPLSLVGRSIGPIVLLPGLPDYARPWRQ
jgi:murein DD-endopeptidase MepM/ murein hydrolase activator NlpD